MVGERFEFPRGYFSEVDAATIEGRVDFAIYLQSLDNCELLARVPRDQGREAGAASRGGEFRGMGGQYKSGQYRCFADIGTSGRLI